MHTWTLTSPTTIFEPRARIDVNLIIALDLIINPAMPANAVTETEPPLQRRAQSLLSPLKDKDVEIRIAMLERLALLLATVASLAVLLHSLPVHVPAASTENARYRRKVAQLRVGSTPMDYMIQLKSDLSDERGTPKNYTQNPTSVWCFMDKGKLRKYINAC